MKNGMRMFSVAVAAGLVGFVSFAAFGVTQETWDSDKTEPIVLTDDLEVTVESGTVVCSGVISGDFKLIKKGAGTLNLAAANTFTGGLDIMRGVVTLSVTGAAGTGKITIDGYTNAGGACQLRFNNEAGAITIGNEIELMSQSTVANAAINLGYEYAGLGPDAQSLTLNGKITAHGDLCIVNSATKSSFQSTDCVTIAGDIDAAGFMVGIWAGFRVKLNGTVTAACLTDMDGVWPTSTGSVWLNKSGNVIATNKVRYVAFYVGASHVLDGAVIYQYATEASRGGIGTYEKHNGPHDQDIAAWINPQSAGDTSALSFKGTVTIKGREGLTEATSYGVLGSTMKLTLDAPGFTQTLSGRTHPMVGPLTVKNGTLKLNGATVFSSLTTLAVLGGTLDAADCTSTAPFGDGSALALQLGTGATLKLNGDLTVASATRDGKAFPKGTWDSIKGVTLSGGRIIVLDGPEPTYEWTGNGGDTLITNPDNWDGPQNLPDLVNGTDILNVDGGATITVASNIKVGGFAYGEGGATIMRQGGATITVCRKIAAEANATIGETFAYEGDEIEFYVASGVILTNASAIAGDFKVRKTGAGRLDLTSAGNTFTSLDIDAGNVMAWVGGSLGSGTITIKGGSGTLRFGSSMPATTFTNDIVVNGDSTSTWPAIFEEVRSKVLTLSGRVTSSGNLWIGTANGSKAATDTVYGEFSGSVTVAAGKTFYTSMAYGVKFTGVVDTDVIYTDSTHVQAQLPDPKDGNNNYPRCGVQFGNSANRIGKFRVGGWSSFTAIADGAWGGAWLYSPASGESSRCQYRIGSTTQTCAYYSTDACKESVRLTTAMSLTGAGTLTLTGGIAKASADIRFADASLVIDDRGEAGDFVQVLNNRPSPTKGSITVKRGTLALTGASSFTNLTALTIAGGTLAVTSTAEKVFERITTLPIGANGRLFLGPGVDAFQQTIELQLTRGATLSIPDGLTVGSLMLDGMPYPKGAHTEIVGVTILGGALTVTEGPEFDNPVVVYVGAGETVTDPDGLTGDKTLVKMGRGNLVLTTPNDFTGGSAIMGGVVEIQNTEALGTGAISIYGSTSVDSQLKINVTKDGFALPITIESDSTREHPAIRFEKTIRLTAPVTAHGDFYFETAWGENTDAARKAYVIFNAPVTVDDGKRIACAPHCEVRFKSGLVTQFLEGYFTEGPAENGGNAGCISVYRSDVTDHPNSIKRLILDQTSFLCGNSDVIDGTVVEWTGEHPKNGYGYLDICGGSQQIGGFYTGENCATATEGLQIINSGAAVTLTLGNKSETDAVNLCSGNWYFVLGENISGIAWKNRNKAPTFRNRRHLVSGEYPHYATTTIGLGASFPRITSSGGSSGSTLTISSKEPDVLDSFVLTTHGSSIVSLTTDEAIACVSRGHKLRITSNRTSGGQIEGSTAYGFSIPAGKTLDAKSAYLHPRSDIHTVVEVPCGKYTQADYCEFIGGSYRVWAPRTAWTNVTWTGAADADLGAVANWTNTDDGEASAATFELPLNQATITSGESATSATANGLVNFGKLTVAGDFTIGGSGVVAFYDEGLQIGLPNANGGSTVTFNVPVDFQTNKLVVAAGDTVKFTKGLTNEVWRTTVGSFSIMSEDSAGTVELGGTIPSNIVFKSGIIAFAEGAALPEADTMTLDLGEGAKISVPQGQVLHVKTVTYGGAAVPVGYFDRNTANFIAGEGRIRIAESTAPMAAETIVWNREGAEGLFSTPANWNPEQTEWGWDDMYVTRFASIGSAAIVDGVYDLRGISFENESGFTLKKGAADAAITVGTDGIWSTNTEVAAARTYAIEPPVRVDKTVNFTIKTNDTLILDHLTGSGSITASDAGDIYIKDAADFAGSFTANALTVNSNEMKVVISGLFGAEGSQGTLTVSGNGRRCCWFSNATVRCKGSLNGPTVSPPTEAGYLVSQRWFYSMDGTTNELFCGIADSGSTAYLTTRPKAKMTLHGGYKQTSKVSFLGGGEFEFVDKPLLCWERRADGFVDVQNGGRLTLNVTGNRIGHLYLSGGSVADFRVSDAWNKDDADRIDAKSPFFPYTMIDAGYGTGTFEFNQTTQFVGRVYGKENMSTLNGTYPALLVIRQGCAEADVGTYYLGAKVTGGLSLRMDGITDGITQLRAASTSVGDLEVTGGTLELYTGASWLNGTNFTARGTGTLKFAAARQVNGDFAKIHFEDNGQIFIPEGVTVSVAEAFVRVGADETALERGKYTGAETEALTANRITGGGALRVGKAGMMFIVK